jgi:hypothetical protein
MQRKRLWKSNPGITKPHRKHCIRFAYLKIFTCVSTTFISLDRKASYENENKNDREINQQRKKPKSNENYKEKFADLNRSKERER